MYLLIYLTVRHLTVSQPIGRTTSLSALDTFSNKLGFQSRQGREDSAFAAMTPRFQNMDSPMLKQRVHETNGGNYHKRSQGVHWVHVHPPGRRKKIGGLIYREVVSAPQAESALPRQSKSPFLGNWAILTVGEVI